MNSVPEIAHAAQQRCSLKAPRPRLLRHLPGTSRPQPTRLRLPPAGGDGEIEATITEAVIAEVVHVLSSKTLYNVSRAEIQDQLVTTLTLKGMRLRAKGTYIRALDIYATTNLDFVDALLVAQVEQTKDATLVSFDRDYNKIPSVTREEP